MAITQISHLSLTGLQTYDSKIKEFIANKVAEGNANSFKFVNLEDGVLKFYTVNPITEDTVPDFEIELPEQDLSHLMALVEGATKGNVASFGDNGQVVDGGIAVADIATKDEVKVVSDALGELDAYIGEIPADEAYADITTVIGYVNKKAEETLNAASGGSSESAASVLASLNTYKSENNAKVQANADAIAAIQEDYLVEADKTELQEQISANASAIELLTNGVDADTVDSVNDLIAYVTEHGAEVTQMQSDISANTKAIEDEVSGRIAADTTLQNNIDLKADASVVEELDARVVVVEGKAHEHANIEELNKIAIGDKAKWDAIEDNSKAYTDAEIAKVNDKIGEVAEGKTVVQLLTEMKEAAVASAEEKDAKVLEDAKAYTDEKVGAIDLSGIATNATAITELQGDVAELQSVQHVEISEEEINQMFQ